MPYSGETANKSTHATIAGDPALRGFLQSCQFVTPPSAAVAQAISAQFFSPPAPALDWLPLDAVAVDGSSYYSVTTPSLRSPGLAPSKWVRHDYRIASTKRCAKTGSLISSN